MSSTRIVRKIRRSKFEIRPPPPPSSVQFFIRELLDEIIFVKLGHKICEAQEVLDKIKITEITQFLNEQNIQYPLGEVEIDKIRIQFTDKEPVNQLIKPIIQFIPYSEQNTQKALTSIPQNQQKTRSNSIVRPSKIQKIIEIKDLEIPPSNPFVLLTDIKLKRQQWEKQFDSEFRQIMLKKRQGRIKKQAQNFILKNRQKYQKYRLNKSSSKHLDSTTPSISISPSCSRTMIQNNFKNSVQTITIKHHFQTETNSPQKQTCHYRCRMHTPSHHKSIHKIPSKQPQNTGFQLGKVKSLHVKSLDINNQKLKRIINRIQ